MYWIIIGAYIKFTLICSLFVVGPVPWRCFSEYPENSSPGRKCLEPGGRWRSILSVFLEHNYVRSLGKLLVLLGKAIFDTKNKQITKNKISQNVISNNRIVRRRKLQNQKWRQLQYLSVRRPMSFKFQIQSILKEFGNTCFLLKSKTSWLFLKSGIPMTK